jgi:hypothetical protein
VLIEYKIKFEKNGLTITQRVESGASVPAPAKPAPSSNLAVSKHLARSFAASTGGGPGDLPDTDGGGPPFALSGPGLGPITILGPIILGGWAAPDDPGEGGGPGDLPDTD